jgi:cell division inhibitor SepF
MSALRRAGVWLGLVEEDDERVEDGLFDDEFADDDDGYAPPRPRSLPRPASRYSERDARDARDSGDARGADRDGREGRDAGPARTRPSDRDARPDRESRGTESRADSRIDRSDSRGSDTRSRSDFDPRARVVETARTDTRTDRGSVRHLARPGMTGGAQSSHPISAQPASAPPMSTPMSSRSGYSGASAQSSFPTQDNLALAPQVQLRERAVVSDESSRRHQITMLHPTTYSEARTIGEHFREGVLVIMNLTEMDEPDAKRLVDFAAGLAFGLRGSMERVTNRVFLLSPPNIQVSDEDKARIAEGRLL